MHRLIDVMTSQVQQNIVYHDTIYKRILQDDSIDLHDIVNCTCTFNHGMQILKN